MQSAGAKTPLIGEAISVLWISGWASVPVAVLMPDPADAECVHRLRRLRETFCDRAFMALCGHARGFGPRFTTHRGTRNTRTAGKSG
jgi:hypothetical protein